MTFAQAGSSPGGWVDDVALALGDEADVVAPLGCVLEALKDDAIWPALDAPDVGYV